MRRATVLALMLACGAPSTARAHVALDPERAQQILAEVAGHHAAAQARGPDAADALYRLGETVENLVELMNQDLLAHGEINLFAQLLVKRLQAYGITVTLAERPRQYAYDLAAFEQYLRRAPMGRRAPESKFRLIARRFHATIGTDPAKLVGTDVSGLLHAITDEERFLSDHPQHDRGPDVRFFLAVDYYRAARNLSDLARARDYAGRARRELTRVVTGSPGTVEARAAETLLETLGTAQR